MLAESYDVPESWRHRACAGPSHFSREFNRLYDLPPRRYVQSWETTMDARASYGSPTRKVG